VPTLGACLSNARLLRPPQIGIFLRSFPLHSPRYARETIAESCSIWVALATAIITQTGSYDAVVAPRNSGSAAVGAFAQSTSVWSGFNFNRLNTPAAIKVPNDIVVATAGRL
jgi:hypothetical protein